MAVLPRARRRGIALLMTMIVVVLFAIVATHYVYTTTTYANIVNGQRYEVQVYWAARRGLYEARAVLKIDKDLAVDRLGEAWTADLATLNSKDTSLDGVMPSIVATDEERKFNILLLQHETDEKTREKIHAFFERLVMIVRRRDDRLTFETGRRPTIRSAEEPEPRRIIDGIRGYLKQAEFDKGEDAAFVPQEVVGKAKKQSPFTILTIGELLMAEHMTPEILYGEKAAFVRWDGARFSSRDGEAEPNPEDSVKDPATGYKLVGDQARDFTAQGARANRDFARAGSVDALPLADFITLWGDGKININTAPKEIIMAMSGFITDEMAEEILRARDKAYEDQRRVRDDEEAPERHDEPDSDAPDEDEKFGFEAAHVASAVAFYNRVHDTLQNAESDGAYQPIEADALPDEWKKAFEDMQPFLTVKSRYFKVTSTAEFNRVRKTFVAVFRRDAAGAAQPPANQPPANQPPANQPAVPGDPATPTPSSPSSTNPDIAEGVPPEPNLRLTLVFLDEEE